MVVQLPARFVEGRGEGGKRRMQLPSHTGALSCLAGEQECCTDSRIRDAARRVAIRALAECPQRLKHLRPVPGRHRRPVGQCRP
jgi:hypothetical protein